eukprot:1699758-Alexandrium_andersonii.AAC.1
MLSEAKARVVERSSQLERAKKLKESLFARMQSEEHMADSGPNIVPPDVASAIHPIFSKMAELTRQL